MSCGVLTCLNNNLQFFFPPLAAGVHHSAPAAGSEGHKLVRQDSAPRTTLAWIDGQEGKEEDFGAHQVQRSPALARCAT